MHVYVRGLRLLPRVLGPTLAVLTLLTIPAAAVSAEVVYEHDFSTDPAWRTDQSEHFFWDADEGVLRAHLENRPTEDKPSRYLVREVAIDPAGSFSIAADVFLEDIDAYGAVVFGLYGDDLANAHVSPGCCAYARIRSEGTFNVQLVSLDGRRNGMETTFVAADDPLAQSWGNYGAFTFETDVWYTLSLSYDAHESSISVRVTDRDSGTVLYELDQEVTGNLAPSVRHLGISGHPTGEPFAFMSQENRLSGWADFKIDNVIVSTSNPAPTPSVASNILFLPGFQASRLYLDKLGFDELWVPFKDGQVELLAMNERGESLEEDIYTKDIVLRAGNLDVYQSLADSLNELKNSGLVSSWEALPYDWRHDVYSVVEHGILEEKGKHISPRAVALGLAQLSTTEKITLVAHSNGGLLAKALVENLEENGHSDLIDRIIFVGSPQLGTSKSIGSLLHGYDQEIRFRDRYTVLTTETARFVSLNMPSAYSLIPSPHLINPLHESIISFNEGEVTNSYIGTYGNTIDTYDELTAFLLGAEGRAQPERDDLATPAVLNAALVERAVNNHVRWEAWRAPEGIGVVTIVGVGLPTPETFHYKQEERRQCNLLVFCETEKVLDYEVDMTYEGDGTVLASSAAYYGDVYYVDLRRFNEDTGQNKGHAEMSGIAPVTELLEYLTRGGDQLPRYVSRDMPEYDVEGVRVSTHSPVAFVVVDAKGRRAGVLIHDDGTRQIVEEIPNSYVIETPESIYVGFANGTEVRVEIVGTGNGTFDLEHAYTHNGNVSAKTRYREITVAETTQASIRFDEEGAIIDFQVDVDGDGTFDVDILATSTEVVVEASPRTGDSGGGGGRRSISRISSPETLLSGAIQSVVLQRSDVEAALLGVEFLYRHGRISVELYTALDELLRLILASEFLFELET